MRTYLEKNRSLPIVEFHDLARRVWGVSRRDIWVSHNGNGETLSRNGIFSFALFLTDFNAEWNHVNRGWDHAEIVVRNDLQAANRLVIFTTDQHEVLVNTKAYYNLVAYLARGLASRISEDDGRTWQTVAQYRQKHAAVMAGDFRELLAVSVEQGKMGWPTPEPRFSRLYY